MYSDPSLNPLLMRGENLLQRPGNRVIVSWRPDEARARLGFAMCRDPQQQYCHVLLLFGVNGRLGFAYKRHSFQESGSSGWVAGRPDRLPGTVLRGSNAVSPRRKPPSERYDIGPQSMLVRTYTGKRPRRLG